MVPEEEEAAAGGVAYFDSDFDWAEHAATAEAQLAAIPVFVEREEEADAQAAVTPAAGSDFIRGTLGAVKCTSPGGTCLVPSQSSSGSDVVMMVEVEAPRQRCWRWAAG